MIGPLTTLVAYLLGSIPFGYLIVHWRKGIDVRSTGSKSIGATNVMRNLGWGGFTVTFLLDFAKGAAAVLLAQKLTANDPRWVAAAALAPLVGHCYPVFLKFRGGKAVATAAGIYMVLAPMAIGIALVIFAILVGIWRYISVGSIVATACFPALVYYLHHPPWPIVLASVLGAALIIFRHRTNISRLLKGTEGRVGGKKAEAPSQ
jgi:glycerol-3-phosphate acyltransferase PlsY